MQVTILLVEFSDFSGSLVSCLIPKETLSLSRSISRILNLIKSSTLIFVASLPNSSHDISVR